MADALNERNQNRAYVYIYTHMEARLKPRAAHLFISQERGAICLTLKQNFDRVIRVESN